MLKKKYFKNEIKIQQNSNGFFSRPLIFNLQSEVLKFNDISVC